MVANKSPQLPERCILQLDDTTIYMLTCLGISYLVLVEYRYPAALAFSFLNHLMKEFTQKYERSKIDSAKRPYNFIEFDSFIHKSRQLYNNPQTLARRVNIEDVNTELSLRPPYRLTVDLNVGRLGVGPPTKLEPLPPISWVAILFASLVALLGIVRGFMALHLSSNVYGSASPWHGFFYLVEAVIRIYQIYLLLYHTRFRILKSWICTSFLLLLIFVLWHLRNPFQHSVFFVTSIFTLYCTIARKIKEKLPNQEV